MWAMLFSCKAAKYGRYFFFNNNYCWIVARIVAKVNEMAALGVS